MSNAKNDSLKSGSKKALITFSTDLHIKESNKEVIIDLFRQQCELATSNGSEYIAILGDVFDSRVSQKEEILNTFSEMLKILDGYELKLVVIPGNHDKTSYSKVESFLTPFKNHHKNFSLVEDIGSINFIDSNLKLWFIPYFTEDLWLQYFDRFTNLLNKCQHILCTHIAVTGSTNNDGSKVSSKISPKMFKDFFKVFSGHYHDMQKVGDNFYHIPSIQQNNFGENSDKGFTVLYSDGSHELIKSKFKEFKKIEIDIDITSIEKINTLIQSHSKSEDNIRFEFKGSESKLKSLKTIDFVSHGIDVKTKIKEVEDDILFAENEEVVEHTKSSIREEFEKFCEKENYEFNKGVKYIDKKLGESK